MQLLTTAVMLVAGYQNKPQLINQVTHTQQIKADLLFKL